MKTTQNRKITVAEQADALHLLTTNQMFALSA
jgi:hypothetical protein